MKKRTKEIEHHQDENTTAETETEIDAEVKDERTSSKLASAPKLPANGLNFGAIFIMLLFGLPMLITGIIYATDYIYPEAAKKRELRQKIIRCYDAANPTKINEVDKFIEKYRGNEYKLFAALRNKYQKHHQCDLR